MNPAQGQMPGQAGQGAQSPAQQAGAQQATGQNPNQATLYQPHQIRALNILSEEEKNKYVAGLEGLWAKIKSSPNGSPEYKQATDKIWNFSKMLQNKISQRQAHLRHHQNMQAQQAAQAQQVQQGQQQPQQQTQQTQQTQQQTPQQRPQVQNQQQAQQQAQQQPAQQPQQQAMSQPQLQMARQQSQQKAQGQQVAPNGTVPNQGQGQEQPQQANNPQGKLPEHVMNHLRQLKIKPLPAYENKPAPEQQKHLNDLRARYGRALMSAETSRNKIRAIDSQVKKREQDGNPFGEDDLKKLNEQRAAATKQEGDARRWIEGFRKAHVIGDGTNNAQNGNSQNMQGANAAGAPQAPQQPNAAAANRASPPNGQPLNQNAAAQQAQAQLQAQQRPQLANNAQQNQQAAQAGRGQAPNAQGPQSATAGGPGRALSHQAAISIANQRAANTASNAQAQQAGGQQQPAVGTPTSAGGAPPANPQQPAQQQQQQPQQPQQAQSQTPIQQQQAQPQQGHPHAHPNQGQTQAINSKLPIPKVLPEKATAVPQGVQLGGGIKGNRPTLNQGNTTMGAAMHQPALQKIPAYNNEAEGDHVLSKKKLDELVRQVCGGSSDGQEGNLLTPEVEEVR